MSSLTIETIPYFNDNFSYLIREEGGKTALIDCGDADPIIQKLESEDINLDFVLLTHHHYDHSDGVPDLKKQFPNITVVACVGEGRLENVDQPVKDGDQIEFGGHSITVLGVPAHTRNCINYRVNNVIFTGDTLFSGGCGRLFEGNGKDLLKAMDKIAALPDDTFIYFGHEYTISNLTFAESIEPTNSNIGDYRNQVQQKLRNGGHSSPVKLETERKINPFLRIDQPTIIEKVDQSGSMTRSERMKVLRTMKDQF